MNPPLQMPDVLCDSASTSAPVEPARAKRGAWWRWLPWALAALVLLTAIITWLVVRQPLSELTPEALTEARQRWRDAGIAGYDLTLETTTSGPPSTVQVQVRDGKLVEVLVNGAPASSGDPRSYTIEGLFDILERELAMIHDPSSPLSSGGKTFLRVRFDHQNGIPLRYLRVISGTNQSSELRVIQFDPNPRRKFQ